MRWQIELFRHDEKWDTRLEPVQQNRQRKILQVERQSVWHHINFLFWITRPRSSQRQQHCQTEELRMWCANCDQRVKVGREVSTFSLLFSSQVLVKTFGQTLLEANLFILNFFLHCFVARSTLRRASLSWVWPSWGPRVRWASWRRTAGPGTQISRTSWSTFSVTVSSAPARSSQS